MISVSTKSFIFLEDAPIYLTWISEIDESKAIKIALGNIDPISGETLADFAEFLVCILTCFNLMRIFYWGEANKGGWDANP